MVAVLDKSGAYVYNCSVSDMDSRVTAEQNAPAWENPDYVKGNVNYDIYGRMRDDMVGWLFCTPDLFHCLEEMNCEAVYLKTRDKDGVHYRKFNREDFSRVESAYRCVLSEKRA